MKTINYIVRPDSSKFSTSFLNGHGHRTHIEIDYDGPATAFNWLDNWTEVYLKGIHIVSRNDQLLSPMFADLPLELHIAVPMTGKQNFFIGYVIDKSAITSDATRGMLSSLLLVDFEPTLDALASWVYQLVTSMCPNYKIRSVAWNEGPDHIGAYTGR